MAIDSNALASLNIALQGATSNTGYINTWNGREFTLDGEFTLEELEAIVLAIKSHNIFT